MTINELKTKQLEYATSTNKALRAESRGLLELLKLYNNTTSNEISEVVKLSRVAEKIRPTWERLYNLTKNSDYAFYVKAANSCIIEYLTADQVSSYLGNIDTGCTWDQFVRILKLKGIFNNIKYETAKSIYDLLSLANN